MNNVCGDGVREWRGRWYIGERASGNILLLIYLYPAWALVLVFLDVDMGCGWMAGNGLTGHLQYLCECEVKDGWDGSRLSPILVTLLYSVLDLDT